MYNQQRFQEEDRIERSYFMVQGKNFQFLSFYPNSNYSNASIHSFKIDPHNYNHFDQQILSIGSQNSEIFSVEYIEKPSQLKELASCLHSILPVSYPEHVYKYVLQTNAEKFSFILRNSDHEVIGGMGCRLEKDPSNPKALRLYCMFLGVYEDYRRNGFARKLMAMAISNASEFVGDDDMKISSVYLHVQSTNDVAIMFYESCGFRRGILIDKYYKRLEQDAYEMSYTIDHNITPNIVHDMDHIESRALNCVQL